MTRFLSIINGIARGSNVADGIYEDSIVVPSGGYAINDVLTLPNGGTYDSVDLKLFGNGKFLRAGVDYNYVGTPDPVREQIELLRPYDEGERLVFRVVGDPLAIYDETFTVAPGGLTSGSLITLLNSKTYFDSELEVYLNGAFLRVSSDYNYSGAIPPRTQIEILRDLEEGEELRFRIDQ